MSIARRRLITLIGGIAILAGMTWLELLVQKKHYMVGGGLSRSFLLVLINIHIAVVVVLLYLIIRNGIKLFLERRALTPGSIFKTNLLFAFVLFSVIPALFVFFTAGRFITKSIDRWFQVHVGKGFDHAQRVHVYHTRQVREVLQRLGVATVKRVQEAAEHGPLLPIQQCQDPEIGAYTGYLVDASPAGLGSFLRQEVRVWRTFRTLNDRTTQSLGRRFLKHIAVSDAPQLFDFYGSLYWLQRVKGRLCVLVYRYPELLRSSLIALEGASNDYCQVLALRSVIYWNYIFTFILITLLILFLSVWCAMYLARGIGKPVQDLLDATNRVRQGAWDTQVPSHPTSDLQTLMLGFNEMTAAVRKAHAELEQKNREMLAILEHVSAAVFLVNRYGRIIFYNNAARDLINLHVQTDALLRKKVGFLGRPIVRQSMAFVRALAQKKSHHLVQEQTLTWGGSQRIFMIYGSMLTGLSGLGGSEQGLLLVIDDLTDVVKMNPMRTWQEAAKQMAHEIKNPLTPIQLSTQRLQRKFKDTLHEDQNFMDCTNTILHQVQIIKDLVTNFSAFASLPLPHFEEADMAGLVSELFNVYQLSYPDLVIAATVSPQPLMLKTDKKRLKRVLINLLENSVRALQAVDGEKRIECTVQYAPNGKSVEILFADTGPGIPYTVKETLFLPHISTEKKNMGLGLAIVHDSIIQLGGAIRLVSSKRGAVFQIVLPM
jgi:two-component system nitrogen regulation sensor histidine kinase NtrY